MASTLIYQFQEAFGAGYIKYSVSRDNTNFSVITYIQEYRNFVNWGLPYKGSFVVNQNVGSAACYGYDKIQYKFQTSEPFAYATVSEYDSPFCGFPVEPCDIAFFGTPIVTAETGPGAEDGSIQVFATSSRTTDIIYSATRAGDPDIFTNSIGKFYDLKPGIYFVSAYEDADISCIVEQSINVPEYDPDFTNYKYRLQIESLEGRQVEVRLIDTNNTYRIADYPKDINGLEASPIIYEKKLKDDTKYSPFAVANLSLNLQYDGLTFTIDEFTRAPEKAWKVEMYFNDVLEFQGYLLPDQTQDEYKDPNYAITLLATDGIPSLKGQDFSDLSLFTTDGSGNPVYQKLYGLNKWAYLMRICLEHLGYDYGETMLINSLQYDLSYNESLWLEIATWGDVFYNNNDEPVNVYDALSMILTSFKLTMIQQKGSFVLVNWNDLYYIDKTAKIFEYRQSFYKFNKAFTTVTTFASSPFGLSNTPFLQSVGKDQPIKPIDGGQKISYDLAYAFMEADIDFDILALLYQDPSFEYGQTVGDLPVGFYKDGTINAEISNTDAYTGVNSLLIDDEQYFVEGSNTKFISNIDPFVIDQPNKKLNLSFYWKPIFKSADVTANPLFQIFLNGDNGLFYKYNNGESGSPPNGWQEIGTALQDQGSSLQSPGLFTEDYNAWNLYNITTSPLPVTGQLHITFKHPIVAKRTPDTSIPGGNYAFYLDNLNISTSDANDAYTFQIGELHKITFANKYSQAEKKTIELSLFTYPPNKRLAGNIFTSDNYLLGDVRDRWSFATSPMPINEKLPAAVIKALSRNYKKPMYKFEGNVKGDNIQFYGMFKLIGYDVLMMPFSIVMDLKQSTSRVTLCECDDSQAEARYNYVPKYEKNARKNIS